MNVLKRKSDTIFEISVVDSPIVWHCQLYQKKSKIGRTVDLLMQMSRPAVRILRIVPGRLKTCQMFISVSNEADVQLDPSGILWYNETHRGAQNSATVFDHSVTFEKDASQLIRTQNFFLSSLEIVFSMMATQLFNWKMKNRCLFLLKCILYFYDMERRRNIFSVRQNLCHLERKTWELITIFLCRLICPHFEAAQRS